MRSNPWQIVLWLFLPGALVGTALDAFYVRLGVEQYRSPTFFGVAWWAPLLLGLATTVIGLSQALLILRLPHWQPAPQRLSSCLAALSWLLLAYVLGVTPLGSAAHFSLLAVIFGYSWLLIGKSWQSLIFSLIVAITGTLIEIFLVHAGAFSYPLSAEMFGVPSWLPLLYACAALAFGSLGSFLLSFYSIRGTIA